VVKVSGRIIHAALLASALRGRTNRQRRTTRVQAAIMVVIMKLIGELHAIECHKHVFPLAMVTVAKLLMVKI
jgi:hypothetical protein